MASLLKDECTTDPTDDDAGPWLKCPNCDVCLNKRDKFLLHLSTHDQETKTDAIEMTDKAIFHTDKGLVLRINELPNAYELFTPKIKIQPLELVCKAAALKIRQPDINLPRPTDADVQAALEESRKRQLRKKPRRKYNIYQDDEAALALDGGLDDIDIEDSSYNPKKGKRDYKDRLKRKYRQKRQQCMLRGKTCVSCNPNIPFPDIKDFTAHITKNHFKDGFYFCTSCPMKTIRRQCLVKHQCIKIGPAVMDDTVNTNPRNQLLTCEKCGKTLTKYSFPSHQEMHKRKDARNKLKPFTCAICKEGFTQKCNLQRHFLKHVENTPFACTFPGCNHKSTGKYHFKRHVDLHYGRLEVFPCTICQVEYSRKERLIEHYRLVHAKDGPQQSFRRRAPVRRCIRWNANSLPEFPLVLPSHQPESDQNLVTVQPELPLLPATGPPDVKQENNGRVYLPSVHFGDEETIKLESRNALLDAEEELEARGIEDNDIGQEDKDVASNPETQVFNNLIRSSEPPNNVSDIVYDDPVVQHLSKVNPEFVKLLGCKYTTNGSEGAFPCKICVFPKISYPRIHHLLSHMKKYHPEEATTHLEKISAESGLVFTCGPCGFQSKTSQQLARHMKTHEGKKFLCRDCGRRFETQRRLNIHVQVVHSQKRDFKCEQCEKAYTSSSGLLKHRTDVHAPKNTEELTCPHCGRTASNIRGFKKHLQLHSKTRVLSYCKICNEKLSCPASLRRHIRLIHMNTKTSQLKAEEPIPESELFL